MRKRRLLTGVTTAILATSLGAGIAYSTSVQAPATKYHASTRFAGPAQLRLDNFTRVDINDPANNDVFDWHGANVPYLQQGDNNGGADTDFTEINCKIVGGHNWCNLEDGGGDCVNVPTSGQYANNGVASSCPGIGTDYTPEMFWRYGADEWENQHTGGDMNTEGNVPAFSANCSIPFQPVYCSNMYFDPNDTYLFNAFLS